MAEAFWYRQTMQHWSGYLILRTLKDKMRSGLNSCRNIISKCSNVLVWTIEMQTHYLVDLVQKTAPTSNGTKRKWLTPSEHLQLVKHSRVTRSVKARETNLTLNTSGNGRMPDENQLDWNWTWIAAEVATAYPKEKKKPELLRLLHDDISARHGGQQDLHGKSTPKILLGES